MKKVIGKVRASIEKYEMIKDGTNIAVGVSGGKDSMSLLHALSVLQRYYPKKFGLTAIIVDMGFPTTTDWSQVKKFCDDHKVKCVIRETEMYRIIFEERKEVHPCSLCARMRRGILHNAALDENCDYIALGHHQDDYVETFFMNLLNNGLLGSFSPVTYLSRKKLWMIRPLIFCEEKEIAAYARKYELPIMKNKCLVDGFSERQNAKILVDTLQRKYPALKQKIVGAIDKGLMNLKDHE